MLTEMLVIMFLAMLQTNTKNLNPENTMGKSEVEMQEAFQKTPDSLG